MAIWCLCKAESFLISSTVGWKAFCNVSRIKVSTGPTEVAVLVDIFLIKFIKELIDSVSRQEKYKKNYRPRSKRLLNKVCD